MLCSACNKAEHSYIENQSIVSETAFTEQVSEIPTEEEKEDIPIESTPTESTPKVIAKPPKEEANLSDTSSNTSSIIENVTAEQVHKIGLEFAEKAWKGYEVLVTTHTDAEHLHNHFVINSVSFENGYKLRQNPSTLISLRNLSDRICLEHGLTVLKPYEKQGRKPSSREYRAAVKGESWKQQLISNIYFAMNRSGNKDEFIKKMKEEGYQVTWTDERKYITFICPNGQKCRDIRLHDNKYLKEVLEQEFKIRSELMAKYYEGTLDEELSDEKFNTGWEKSRAVYFKLLDCSYQDSEQTNEAKAREYYQNYIQNQTPCRSWYKRYFRSWKYK